MEYAHQSVTKLYRCQISLEVVDEIDFSCELIVKEIEYDVIRYTPKGYIVKIDFGYFKTKEKFILRGQGKRFAHENKYLASESFYKRSKRRILILENQLEISKQTVKIAYEHFSKQNPERSKF